jgi:hypothetical protein
VQNRGLKKTESRVLGLEASVPMDKMLNMDQLPPQLAQKKYLDYRQEFRKIARKNS